jgi:hypothetical protein
MPSEFLACEFQSLVVAQILVVPSRFDPCSSRRRHTLRVDGALLVVHQNFGMDGSIGCFLVELDLVVVDVDVLGVDGDLFTEDLCQFLESNALGFRHEEVDVEDAAEGEADEELGRGAKCQYTVAVEDAVRGSKLTKKNFQPTFLNPVGATWR